MAALSLKTPPSSSSPTNDVAKPRSRRRRGRGWIALGAVLIGVYFLPVLATMTSLRNLPLRMVFAKIDGTITCQSASLGWFSAIEFNGVEVCDSNGDVVLEIPAVTIDRTPLAILADLSRLGKVTVHEPQLKFTAAGSSSNFEEVFLPWWNTPSSGPIELELTIEDGTVEVRDEKAKAPWKVRSLAAALQLSLDDIAPVSWSASGQMDDQSRGSFTASSRESNQGVELKAQKLPVEMFRWIARRLYGNVDLAGELTCELVLQPQQRAGGGNSPYQALRGQLALANFTFSGGPLHGDKVRLREVSVEADCLLSGEHSDVRRLAVTSDIGSVKGRGEFRLPDSNNAATIEAVVRQTFSVEGSLDLARLAKMLPQTLHLRSDTVVDGGQVHWRISSESAGEDHRWQAHVETSGLAATTAGKPLRWEKPILIELAARKTTAGLVVDSLACSSDFFELNGKGTIDELNADLTFDLGRLRASVGQLVDLQGMNLAGDVKAQLHYERDPAGAVRTTAQARLTNFRLGTSSAVVWAENDLNAQLQMDGQTNAGSLARIDAAVLQVVAASTGSANEALEIHLREPIAINDKGILSAFHRVPLLAHLSGNLAQWRTRLSPWIDLNDWQLAGPADLHGNLTWTSEACDLVSLKGTIQQLQAQNGEWFIQEPIVQLDVSGRYDGASKQIQLAKSTIESSTASIKTDKISLTFAANKAPALAGQIAFVADLEKLQRWTFNPRHPPAIIWAGQLGGRANLSASSAHSSLKLNAAIDNFAALSTQPPASQGAQANPLRAVSTANANPSRYALWQERQLTVALAGSYLQSDDSMNLEDLQVGSEGLKVRAFGGIRSLQNTANLNLRGEAQCDWSRLSRILVPYLGDNVRIEGQDTRQFAVQGPIGELLNGRPLTTAAAAAGPADTLAWIKPLTAEGGVGWQRASMYGMNIGQGEIAVDLHAGVLTVRPLELAVSEGKLRLAPKAVLTPSPAVLIQERAKVIERVHVSPEMTATWLKYIAPAVAEATETRGELSLDLDGAKVPLFNPAAADIGGRLAVHSLQVSPGPTARVFVLLAEQIRALVERRPPPLELSSNPTLLAINDQQIVFRMLDGRVYHQGMTMNVGNVTIRTHGLVGLDESLNLVADVPVKAEWFGGGAAPAGLKDQTFQIPIGGTLQQPRIDPRAMQQVIAAFAQGAVRDAVENQINKQLDRLFQPR